MTRLEMSSRPELRSADDAVIQDAIAYAGPMNPFHSAEMSDFRRGPDLADLEIA
jgi:hypothetical protein